MRLESRDGAWFDLGVLRRQRSGQRALRRGEPDWMTDWLVVRGEMRLADGPRWTFREPCLMPWEGQRLGAWLRAVAGRDGGPGVPPGSVLVFTEPVLSMALDDARDERRLIRVHLAGAAGLPDPDGGGHRGGGVAFDLDADALRRAATSWSAELAAVG